LRYANQYNLVRYIPEKANVHLHARSCRLRTDTSWTEQGHPFYSGMATYVTTVEIPSSWPCARLILPEVGSVCEITIDDHPTQKRLWQPYEVVMDAKRGARQVRITVNNTCANALEYYRAPSGILAQGYCQQSTE